MGFKSVVKHALLGKPGLRPRSIKVGLLSGLRFNVNTAGKSMRLLALDEREIASVTRELTRDAVTALDIGANDGWYSLYFASRPNIQRVFSFDGSGKCLTALRANLELNGKAVVDKVTIVNKLVGEQDDEQFCSVDQVAAGAAEPLLMKIDVDGAEMQVLRGAAATLRDRRCSLLIETHSVELERECVEFLTQLGYRCRIIRPGWYRAIVPEGRSLPHNQWLVATR